MSRLRHIEMTVNSITAVHVGISHDVCFSVIRRAKDLERLQFHDQVYVVVQVGAGHGRP